MDVYDVLKYHLESLFNETKSTGEKPWSATIFEHSYDEVKGIFRFDAEPSGKY